MQTGFVEDLRKARLLGILRGCPDRSLDAVADAAERSGLKFLEVTMNTPGAAGQISRFAKRLDGICRIGAGTVLTALQAKEAVDAGASFLVSPCYADPVQKFADRLDIPTLPGAFTPTEIWNAHVCGAAMVKVFPAKSAGGPAYFKELRGPFKDLPMLACGGVSPANAMEYIRDGADALAFGGSVFTKDRLEKGDTEAIAADILALMTAIG